jgi:CIC family chloride channel protein
VFVAETTGGHSYIIPSLISAAVAYAISGEASVSGDQHLHETAELADLSGMIVRDVIQHRCVIFIPSTTTIREFVETVATCQRHTIFPVYENNKPTGIISLSDLSQIAPKDWENTTVGARADRDAICLTDDCELSEALRLLVGERGPQMLLVTDSAGALQGVVTKTDILRAVRTG